MAITGRKSMMSRAFDWLSHTKHNQIIIEDSSRCTAQDRRSVV
jgi:hypothetical protein